MKHCSDCAVNNEPAYPRGDCDCGYLPSNPYYLSEEDNEERGRYLAYDEAQKDMLKIGFERNAIIFCPECYQYKPDDERVKAGMKCTQCAY